MTLSLIGATGATGLELLQQALERDHSLAVLARDPRALPPRLERVRVVHGDALDPGDVERLVRGSDAVLSVLGARLGQPVGRVRSEGTRNLVRAMEASSVARLVVVSTVGVGDSLSHQGSLARLLLPRIIGRERLDEAARQEAIVRESALAWTIVRPPRLLDGPPIGRVRAATDLRTGFTSKLVRADLARFMLDQLDDGRFIGAAVTVVN